MKDKPFIAPRQRGAIILFDSSIRHRVLKVKKGVRRSIVGWVLGSKMEMMRRRMSFIKMEKHWNNLDSS